MRRILLFFFILLTVVFSSPIYSGNIFAASQNFATIVIPFRGREYWQDFAKPRQILDYLNKEKLPSTVLLTYANLNDTEVVNYLHGLKNRPEMGLFLEVDQQLANDSLVSYHFGDFDKAAANQILFSGYQPDERIRMADRLVTRFKSVFGELPSSAGAWYVDAVTVNYLQNKYSLAAILGVADQYVTDTYGLWGKPWGIPYISSLHNPLIPAGTDKAGPVAIQWAARDPIKGYGLTVGDSTYSFQANDYINHHNLSISYFRILLDSYFDKLNPINQVTVGLEAGQEGWEFLDEFVRQIAELRLRRDKGEIRLSTMRQFAGIFKGLSRENQPASVVYGLDREGKKTAGWWFNFSAYRAYLELSEGVLKIRDLKVYQPFFFNDLLTADREPRLERYLPSCLDDLSDNNSLLIAEDIIFTSVKRQGDIFNLDYQQKENSGRLTLDRFGIRNNGRLIVKFEDKQPFWTGYFNRLLLDYYTWKKSSVRPLLVYSKIEGSHFAGLYLPPEKLLGFKSSAPFFGLFSFPYQTLAKFKSFPLSKIGVFFHQDLLNGASKCKIIRRI
ncbi:MAG: hypothetical protein UV73_C0001G0175 [Candidatus Gottesmanbacteria bacterium GW2011_GWA2_43_14]|uniref:Uncharacterized protein n=1 Tax=Candidatus Gottesmanbacteria bacterium GW2011_GWA2_43_14 TaxID=1618443 RepID=A0A0G1DM03_9BACT|nr:MAG: hypothetical protein UV73_C0001G0175 [Candidatus Gottesmanbacteria bacterium GW2011_GWA2_43_14]